MPRTSFQQVLSLMCVDPVFPPANRRGCPQCPVTHQLMVALKDFGGEGSGSSLPGLCDVFGTGWGTNSVFIHRVATALHKLRDAHVRWPNTNERAAIADRIQDICELPNCVSAIDGTLFPLAFSPQTVDAPDYKGKKHGSP